MNERRANGEWARGASLVLLLSAALISSAALASAPRGASQLELAPPSLALERALASDEPSGFALGLTSLDAPPQRFAPLAGVELVEDLAQDLHRLDEPSYPKTRIGGLRLFGQDLYVVSTPLSVEVRWGCEDFSCGIAEGDGVNLYAFVGQRPHEKTDPLGLAGDDPIDEVAEATENVIAGVNRAAGRTVVTTLTNAAVPTGQIDQMMAAAHQSNAIDREDFSGRPLGEGIQRRLQRYRTGIAQAWQSYVSRTKKEQQEFVGELGFYLSLALSGLAKGPAAEAVVAEETTAAAPALGGMSNPERGAVVFGGGRRVAPKPTVERVNGRLPRNYRYAGEEFPKLPEELAAKYPGVQFTEKGFVDLNPYAKARAQIKGLSGEYAADAAKANKAVGLSSTPSGYTWHHVEDTETLLLVPQDLHDAVPHTGGAAILKAARKQ